MFALWSRMVMVDYSVAFSFGNGPASNLDHGFVSSRRTRLSGALPCSGHRPLTHHCGGSPKPLPCALSSVGQVQPASIAASEPGGRKSVIHCLRLPARTGRGRRARSFPNNQRPNHKSLKDVLHRGDSFLSIQTVLSHAISRQSPRARRRHSFRVSPLIPRSLALCTCLLAIARFLDIPETQISLPRPGPSWKIHSCSSSRGAGGGAG